MIYSVYVVNVNDPPNPVLNNLYLTEVTGPVKINLTTIDSTDPMDNYTKLVVYNVATTVVFTLLVCM